MQISSLKTAQDPNSSNSVLNSPSPDSPRMDDDDTSSYTTGVSLPLTRDMIVAFDTLLERYQQLANLVLYTLRLEVRLRTMHYLDKASRDGVYQLAEDIAEPDAAVVDLNMNLAEFDECAATTLGPSERRYVIELKAAILELIILEDTPRFIFEGLSAFMDHLLISNSRHIRLANKNGLVKMNRNILALQQNLKNIGDAPLEVNFDRSRKFWEVFGRGPSVSLVKSRYSSAHLLTRPTRSGND